MHTVRVRFMRHSESCSNVLSSAASARMRYRNPELTTRGHRMATERQVPEAAIYSTPLRRARQTARHFGRAQVIPYVSIEETFRRIGALGHRRILIVHHKGFLRRLTKWITGSAIEFGNLDAVEVVARFKDGGLVGVPTVAAIDRYRLGEGHPPVPPA